MKFEMTCSRASVVVAAVLGIAACSRGEPETAFARSTTARAAAIVQSQATTPARGEALRLVLAPAGNEARYRVRERLVGHDLPNDAIGATKSLTGAIAFDSSGNVIRAASKFTVDAGSFVSDKDRRDGFVRGRLLEADEYPTVTLVPTGVRGVSLPLPKSGTAPIEMTGDLTVRGVTRPTTWRGTAEVKNGQA